MPYAEIDLDLIERLTALGVSEDGINLFIRGVIWCNQNLTDGRIPKVALPRLSAKPTARRHATELVTKGRWDDAGDAWQVHDYLDWNPSREEVLERKARHAEVMRLHRRTKGARPRGRARDPASDRVSDPARDESRDQSRDPAREQSVTPLQHPASSMSQDRYPELDMPPRVPDGGANAPAAAAAPPASRPARRPRKPVRDGLGAKLDALCAAWNQGKHATQPAVLVPPELTAPMAERLEAIPLDGPGSWAVGIEKMARSRFCLGLAGDPERRAVRGLPFLLRNIRDVLNGAYDDRTPTSSSAEPEWKRQGYGSIHDYEWAMEQHARQQARAQQQRGDS